MAVGGQEPAEMAQQGGGTQSSAHPSFIPPHSNEMESHCCCLLGTAFPNPSLLTDFLGWSMCLGAGGDRTLTATAISPDLAKI